MQSVGLVKPQQRNKPETVHGERFITREAMRQTVFEYIETDNNHSANNYRSPVNFEVDFYQ
jgi:hypothetical protein